MPRISWDAIGQRYYESGLDRGVLYTSGNDGVPWSGLISVDEKPSGGGAVAYYIDGQKYINMSAAEEYAATITAYTYPDEFEVCDGTARADTGLFVMHQRRQSFGLSYRTMVGNDLGDMTDYKIHIIYNALAAPSDHVNSTMTETPSTSNFSWQITAIPPDMPGFRPSAHLMIDTRIAHPGAVSDVEDILYGTDSTSARLPDLAELITVFDTNALFIVIDNGDGTWTATAPDELDVITIMSDVVSYDQTVLDNFDDNSFNMTLWGSSGSGITETSGKLHIPATTSYPSVYENPAGCTHDLALGFFATQYSHSGTPDETETVFFGAVDPNGNTFDLQYAPWNAGTWMGATGDTTVSDYTFLSGPTIADGDWVGVGNLGDDNIVHIYHSVDGETWTEFISFTIGGTFNKYASGLQVGCGASSGTSPYVAGFDNASFIHEVHSGESFTITWPSAVPVTDTEYTLSSL